MAITGLIDSITDIVSDARTKDFSYDDTMDVPSVNTTGLTYESGISKKGKKIKTCVLFVDIRDSVKMVEKHHSDTMGKIYLAFTKSVLKIADHHNGKVRNIIGDRVMIVFPTENCFTNSVNCAISINHATNIINSKFENVDFKCGIGIDYGEMKILKVGIEKKGGENQDNKNLVWVGYPANRASRLTDMANKQFEDILFHVTKENFGFNRITRKLQMIEKIIKYTPEKFAYIIDSSDGEKVYIEEFDKIKKIEKHIRKVRYMPILITESVFKSYAKVNPEANDIVNNWWEVQEKEIKDIEDKVYGAGLIWKAD